MVIEPQQDFSHTISTDNTKGPKESRTGIYKAGGPTTFFGSDAVGPFRGEMSSTKKAMLARENLTEENWMHACALSILEANEELRRGRAERLIPNAGLDEIQVPIMQTGATTVQYVPSSTPIVVLPTPQGGEGGEQAEGGGEVDTKTLEAANAASPKPVAVYEVHTGILHCESSTIQQWCAYIYILLDPQSMQSTKVRWAPVRNTKHKPVIGGLASVGSAAWGVARIDYVTKDEGAYKAELKRIEKLEAELADAEKNGPPAIKMDWDV